MKRHGSNAISGNKEKAAKNSDHEIPASSDFPNSHSSSEASYQFDST